uniref:Reverse transcriptase domain-containing protein n=1 Tax=Tanacetum cinerariifolium TaxID=118510 RepID=A0A6L2LPM8_TANCI|nr:reverse transcriptase domain-containing protein [Tanacetum cinerariifolium]
MGSGSQLYVLQSLNDNDVNKLKSSSNGVVVIGGTEGTGSSSPSVEKWSCLKKWRRIPRGLALKKETKQNGGLLVLPNAGDGEGSENSEDQRSRSSSDTRLIGSVNGDLGVGDGDDQPRSERVGPGKKARGFRVESSGDVGSDSGRSGFVFVQGATTDTVASKGGESGMFAKYDEEEDSDDVNYDDKIVNEEAPIGFVKSDDDDDDVSQEDNSGKDEDVLVESIKGLDSAQEEFARDTETEFEDHLKKRIQVEEQYIVISTKTETLTSELREIRHNVTYNPVPEIWIVTRYSATKKASCEFGDTRRYHLSRLENPHEEKLNESDINDRFPFEFLMYVDENDDYPWFVGIANYLARGTLLKGMPYQQKKKFFADIKYYLWEDPYLFRVGSDQVIRRCVHGKEAMQILEHCHSGPTRGHNAAANTAKKVFEVGFNWPTIFKDTQNFIKSYDACQKAGNVLRQDEMLLAQRSRSSSDTRLIGSVNGDLGVGDGDDQSRSERVGPGKKARGFRVESIGDVGSDSGRSGFVFVQGATTGTVASKGGESGMFVNYDEEEDSDDVNYDDKIVNEEAPIGFVKSDDDDDVLQEDNSGKDEDVLVESIKGLDSAQEEFAREVQKWKDVGKDDPSIFDDPILNML